MTIKISRSLFIQLARRGTPVQVVQQLAIPDVPTVAAIEYFSIVPNDEITRTVPSDSKPVRYLVAWMLLPRCSQDTRMVIDTRAALQLKRFHETHGVVNTITAEGTSSLGGVAPPQTPAVLP